MLLLGLILYTAISCVRAELRGSVSLQELDNCASVHVIGLGSIPMCNVWYDSSGLSKCYKHGIDELDSDYLIVGYSNPLDTRYSANPDCPNMLKFNGPHWNLTWHYVNITDEYNGLSKRGTPGFVTPHHSIRAYVTLDYTYSKDPSDGNDELMEDDPSDGVLEDEPMLLYITCIGLDKGLDFSHNWGENYMNSIIVVDPVQAPEFCASLDANKKAID